MKHFSSLRGLPARPTRLLAALALLLTLLPALTARAQAPTWQLALALAPTQPVGATSSTRATATDAAGNVYITGAYSGQVQFGSTLLTSAGSNDVFVACYRPASLNPTSGPVGSSIMLTGTGFGAGATVSFNGMAATGVVVNSPTGITATVPTGASTGNVTVTTPGGTSNGVAFTVTAPVITLDPSLLPSGQVGVQYPSISLSATGAPAPTPLP